MSLVKSFTKSASKVAGAAFLALGLTAGAAYARGDGGSGGGDASSCGCSEVTHGGSEQASGGMCFVDRGGSLYVRRQQEGPLEPLPITDALRAQLAGLEARRGDNAYTTRTVLGGSSVRARSVMNIAGNNLENPSRIIDDCSREVIRTAPAQTGPTQRPRG